VIERSVSLSFPSGQKPIAAARGARREKAMNAATKCCSGAVLICLAIFMGTSVSWDATLAVASPQGSYSKANYILPAEVRDKGVTFAGVRIPIDQRQVSSRVVEQINFLLMDRRATTMEWFDRMAVYGPLIRGVLSEEKAPEDLLYLATLLSDLLPNARTRSGGVGWWALGAIKDKKDSTLAQWVATNDWDDRRDPVLSTRIVCAILQAILKKPNTSNWLMTICAYADGADKIDAIVEKAKGYSYWEMVMPPYSETLIPRLVALKIIDAHREFYGVDVPPLPPLAFDSLDRLKLLKDLPLHVVAKWCGTNPRAIWELNPGVDPSVGILPVADKRSPSGFPLRVPKDMGRKVRQSLVNEGYLSN
jgi:membrane-bound lytic murein transglycosylase D